MAMKFNIFEDAAGEWRWNAESSGSIIFSSGEGFEKPQKVVQVIRKNIVREDEKLEAALVKALKAAGLNEKGGQLKTEKPVKVEKESKPAKIQESAAWPFPTGQSVAKPTE